MWEALIVAALVLTAIAVVVRRAGRALRPGPSQRAAGCASCADRAGCCAATLGPVREPTRQPEETCR